MPPNASVPPVPPLPPVPPVRPLPPLLRWMADDPRTLPWLRSVPRLLEECAARWGLVVGEVFPGASVSWTCRVTRSGEPAVLKLQWPHEECEHEADALRAWGGRGAVRLLDADPDRHALLLEECRPGHHLSARPHAEALAVLAELLPRLWIPADRPFTRLEDEAAGWRREMPRAFERAGRPFEPELLDRALAALDRVAPTQGERVLLHQDLHADNVLARGGVGGVGGDGGEGGEGGDGDGGDGNGLRDWVAIDPKPLVGERAFGLAPIIRSAELGHSRELVVERLRTLSAALDLDVARVRDWALAQTLAWGFKGSGAIRDHVEAARWLAAFEP